MINTAVTLLSHFFSNVLLSTTENAVTKLGSVLSDQLRVAINQVIVSFHRVLFLIAEIGRGNILPLFVNGI